MREEGGPWSVRVMRVDQYNLNHCAVVTSEGQWLVSYGTIVLFKPNQSYLPICLDKSTWDYSRTTGKYRNKLLGEDINTTRLKIARGEYLLTNLND